MLQILFDQVELVKKTSIQNVFLTKRFFDRVRIELESDYAYDGGLDDFNYAIDNNRKLTNKKIANDLEEAKQFLEDTGITPVIAHKYNQLYKKLDNKEINDNSDINLVSVVNELFFVACDIFLKEKLYAY